MELVELGWNGQNDLFFQFQKEESEPHDFLAEDVQNLNIKFELAKVEKYDLYKEPPFLVSVKQLHFVNKKIFTFSVTLEDLNDVENLQINIIKVTIFLATGNRLDISINKKFALSDLTIQDSDYFEFLEEETIYKRKRKVSIRKTKSKNRPKRSSSIIDVTPSQDYSDSIIKKNNSSNPNDYSIQVSQSEYEEWLELKGNKSWETTMFMVREGFGRLNELKEEVKDLNKTIQQIALKSAGSSQSPIYLQSPPNISPNQLNPPPQNGPPKSKGSPKVNSKYNLSDQSSHKVFRDKKNPNTMKYQIELMREMKEKFSKVSNVKEILTKVPEEELQKPRAKTDHLAFLEFKYNDNDKKRKSLIEKLKSLGFENDAKSLSIEEIESILKKDQN